MIDRDFTVLIDEYVVIDVNDGFVYFWSISMAACVMFLRVNKSLRSVKLLHI